jgi:hypothetical protein
MVHFKWIEHILFSNILRLEFAWISKNILVESQNVLSRLSTSLSWWIVVLVLNSWTSIEATYNTVAEQTRMLIQMTVDDWSSHLSIYISNGGWKFASWLAGSELVEADWVAEILVLRLHCEDVTTEALLCQ